MAKNPDEIGCLWRKQSDKAGEYFTGVINGQNVVVFKNRAKKTDKQPDYRVLISKPKDAA